MELRGFGFYSLGYRASAADIEHAPEDCGLGISSVLKQREASFGGRVSAGSHDACARSSVLY